MVIPFHPTVSPKFSSANIASKTPPRIGFSPGDMWNPWPIDDLPSIKKADFSDFPYLNYPSVIDHNYFMMISPRQSSKFIDFP